MRGLFGRLDPVEARVGGKQRPGVVSGTQRQAHLDALEQVDPFGFLNPIPPEKASYPFLQAAQRAAQSSAQTVPCGIRIICSGLLAERGSDVAATLGDVAQAHGPAIYPLARYLSRSLDQRAEQPLACVLQGVGRRRLPVVVSEALSHSHSFPEPGSVGRAPCQRSACPTRR